MKNLMFISLLLFFNTTFAKATIHAPIGVMGDHVHKKGELMLSTRVMKMEMSGMRAGTKSLKDSDYSQMIKPQEMSMTGVMLGGMYGVTGKLTIMPMVGYLKKSMELKNAMSGVVFETESNSITDLKLNFLYEGMNHLVFKLGLSAPIGSIEETDTIPTMGDTRLPYPMQIGSGTFDSTLGLTYSIDSSAFNFGGQLEYLWRHDYNDQGYRLGNEFQASTWAAYQILAWWSASLRANYQWRNNISGKDNNLRVMPAMNPTANQLNYGRSVVNTFIGSQFGATAGVLKGHRFAFEVGLPIIQNLHGPQMKSDYALIFGWQKAFY